MNYTNELLYNVMVNSTYFTIMYTIISTCLSILYLFHMCISGGNGAWSTDGCTTNGRDSDGNVIGQCNHLTTFAVLNVSCAFV